MPSKAGVHVRKTVTRKTVKVKRGSNKKGNPNKCPVCGKFVGNNHG